MEYIDKDALVAEIERLKDEYLKHSRNKSFAKWSCGTLDNIRSFIDTLEVKDVDDEPKCKIFPRPIGCYSTCKECPLLAVNNKAQKGESV